MRTKKEKNIQEFTDRFGADVRSIEEARIHRSTRVCERVSFSFDTRFRLSIPVASLFQTKTNKTDGIRSEKNLLYLRLGCLQIGRRR